MSGIRLIVGLGNPGREYAEHRHNAGFWWVERIASARGVTLNPDKKFYGLAARAHLAGHEVWLLEPQTYMNRSGQAVGALASFYKITPEEILVVHDELDLPPGEAKLKKGGGHGGHNGLRDIIAHLGGADFWRLRLGIGHPGDKSQVADFVLHPPRREEQGLIEDAMDKSLPLLPQLLAGDFSAAMLKLHTKAK